jgi:hypothetical protein
MFANIIQDGINVVLFFGVGISFVVALAVVRAVKAVKDNPEMGKKVGNFALQAIAQRWGGGRR